MVKSNQPSPIWPYLGILVLLFAAAVTAPRGWQSLARRESIQEFLDRHPPEAAKPAEPAPAETAEALSPQPVEPQQAEASVPAEPSEASDSSTPIESESRLAHGATMRAISLAAPSEDETASDAAPAASQPSPDNSSPIEAREPEPRTVEAPSQPARPAGWLCPARPERLLAELSLLSANPRTAAWARSAQQALEQLCQIDLKARAVNGSRSAASVLAQLRQIALAGESLAKSVDDPALEIELLRAQYALVRRVEIWDAVSQLPIGQTVAAARPTQDKSLAAALARADQYVRSQPNGAVWRDYLLLDSVAGLLERSDSAAVAQRREMASLVLSRLATGEMSDAQRRYLKAAPLVQLRTGLRPWTVEAVDPQTLIDDLERYEQSEESPDGRRLADHCRNLCWSSDPALRLVGARLDEHYRNANIRLAVAGTFLNRLVPQPGTQVGTVRDTIVGADVYGRSSTKTHLEVVLVPDRTRLRIGLEAHGTVTSSTAASSGPAVFYNNGESQFVVRKLFLCDAHNLNVFPAQAEAEAKRSDLVSVETDFDGVPLVGAVVRNIAISQHADLEDQARFETEGLVAKRARDQLESEIARAVDKMKSRYNDQVLQTLERMDMELEPLALATTEDRAVMRMRLAGSQQLAAYTPRPRAPSDSLMSLQVHESALNNALEKLQLEGRTFALGDLFGHLRTKLNRLPHSDADADLPEDVVVTFASTDAVRVHCRDGRVQVRIALADLREGKRHWHDFAVVTYYRPDTSVLDIHFVRDGTIFLEGESLKGKPEVALRTIFSKVLSAQRGWGLLSPEVDTDPRFADVTISQFSVDQGWIGLAYAQRPQVARKPREQPGR